MSQTTNFRIKRQYSIIPHSPNIVELRYGVWNPVSFTLTDEAEAGHLFKVLSCLDGSRTPAELAREERIPLAEVEALIDHLNDLGVIESDPTTALDHYLGTVVPWRADNEVQTKHPIILMGDPDGTLEIQRYLKDSLQGTDLLVANESDPAWQALTENDTSWLMDGIDFQERMSLFERWRDKLLVVVMKCINPGQLRILNKVCLQLRTPWIHAAMDGPFLFIGPIIVPHRTACYECLETRVMMNLREHASYQRYKQIIVEGHVKTGQQPVIPAILGMLAAHTALETLNFALTGSSFTINKVLAIYLPTMEFTFNEVLRNPNCSVCSPSSERDDKELYFDMGAFIER